MTVTLAIIGDTHVSKFEDLPQDMLNAIQNTDYIVHVGDYTSKNILHGLKNLKKNKFIGVYGNTDPQDIREIVSERAIIEIEGKKIGITHPASGGSHKTTLRKVLALFRSEIVDVIIFGHTHYPKIENHNSNILIINPGKGYLEEHNYGPSASMIIVTINDEINAKIIEIKE